MKLADAQMRIPHNDMHGRAIFDGIRRGMEPFRAEEIYVWMDFDIDCNEYRVCAEVRLKGGSHISHVVRSNAWELADNPTSESVRIALEMEKGFRDREDFALAPLIYLGEN